MAVQSSDPELVKQSDYLVLSPVPQLSKRLAHILQSPRGRNSWGGQDAQTEVINNKLLNW